MVKPFPQMPLEHITQQISSDCTGPTTAAGSTISSSPLETFLVAANPLPRFSVTISFTLGHSMSDHELVTCQMSA